MLSVICFVLAFCPSFLVSCSGTEVNVGVMTAVRGYSIRGQKVVDPQPIAFVMFVIPVVIFALLMMKKYGDKKKAIIIAVLAVCDSISWAVFLYTVASFSKNNYCTFETTGFYKVNSIVHDLIILLSILVAIKKLQMDSNLLTLFSGDGKQKALNQMAETMSQMSGAVTKLAGNVENKHAVHKDTIGFCSKCGSSIEYGCKFCSSCGAPVPESMIEEAETARREAEEKAKAEAARREAEVRAREEAAGREAEENARAEVAEKKTEETVKAEGQHLFCLECGAKLAADAKFCASCGAKVE